MPSSAQVPYQERKCLMSRMQDVEGVIIQIEFSLATMIFFSTQFGLLKEYIDTQ